MSNDNDFYSSVRQKGNKVNSSKEFVSHIYFRGEVPYNVVMKEIPSSINKPVWVEDSETWIDKGEG